MKSSKIWAHSPLILHKGSVAAGAGPAALGAMALATWRRTKKVEQRHPPIGRFLNVDGVRLHYVDRGSGEPLVLVHGNGSQIEDFATSGLIDLAARTYRVIVFDRPGFGHSSRPRGTIWTPPAQADLLHKALAQVGIQRFILFGHSWGASVAVAMALRHAPSVEGLVLASGYFYPTDRFDATFQVLKASPIIGDILACTAAPLVGRIGWARLMKKIFGPADVSASFSAAIKEMALRPSQLRASAAESTLMIPNAIETKARYGELDMPVSIVVGEADQLINPKTQSIRLHGDISGSNLRLIPRLGHMVHHGSPPEVMKAINRVARI